MNLNSHNIDADGDNNPTGRSANNGSSSNTGGRDMNSNASNPERWILVLAIAILVLGAILLTLRSAIFSLILIIVGIVLFTYWLYGVVRTRERGRHSPEEGTISLHPRREVGTGCTCSVCKHSESKMCIGIRCACCVLMRNKQIIGHFNKAHR